MKKRSADAGGGGFYLSDLHFCCTDTALFRRIIITLLGTRAREGETVHAWRGETGNNSAVRPLVSFFTITRRT